MTVETLLPFAYLAAGGALTLAGQWGAEANRRRLERARARRQVPIRVRARGGDMTADQYERVQAKVLADFAEQGARFMSVPGQVRAPGASARPPRGAGEATPPPRKRAA